MYYRVLNMSAGLEVEVTGDGLDADCKLRVAPGPWHEVPLEVAALLWWVDGARTIESLHELAAEAGATLSLERVEGHLRALAEAGLVSFSRLDGVPHALLPGTMPHACEGCGRSCEGHLVGPLPVSEVETLRALLPALQALEPALAGQTPFMVVARKPGLYLRLVEGRCVFLDDQRRCRVHKHFGAEAKPSICRLFPYVRVLTEDGYRFAVAPGCFVHHKQARTQPGEPRLAPLDPGFGTADVALLRQARPEPPHDDAASPPLPSDDQLVLWLGAPGATLRDLLQWLLPAHREGAPSAPAPSAPAPSAPPRAAQPAQVSAQAVALCAAFGARLLPALEGERSFIGNIARQGGPFAQSLRALTEAIRQAPARAHADLALPPQTEAWLLDALRRSLFIRDALAFPDTPRAVAALLAGWVIALAAGPDPAADPDAAHEAACALWATWYRVIPHSGLGQRLFDSLADAHALLRALLGEG